MRNFIDIISKSLTESASPAIAKDSFLLEAKAFEAMFGTIEAIGKRYKQNDVLEVLQECKIAVAALKRSDRQIWAARILRIWMFDQMSAWTINLFDADDTQSDPHNHEKEALFAQFKSEVTKLDSKYKAEYLKTIGEDWNSDRPNDPKNLIFNTIPKHYLGIPYSKIQNYVFGKSIIDTIDDLHNLEEEFKTRKKGLVTLEHGDKIFIKMPDNYVWVLLDRGYCSIEANAMGHCGNAGAKDGDRILSLRQIRDTVDGVQYMRVFLTFILNGDGKLGEMKGSNNDKPAEKYHSQIITLLQNPIIKGIRGGGWLPKNNFNINDLPEDVREKLLDTHPHLGNWQARYKKAMASGDKEFFPQLIAAVRESHSWTNKAALIDDDKGQQVMVYEWGSIDDFVDEMSDDDHTKEVAKSDYSLESYETPSDDRIESFMESLPVQYQILLGKAAKALMEENGEDEGEIEEFDESSMSEVLQKLDEYGSELKSALEGGVISGEESGAQIEAHEYLVKAIKSFQPNLGHIDFSTYTRTDGESGWAWDAPVKLVVTVEQACALADKAETNGDETDDDDDLKTVMFSDDDELKIDPPYYGYSGFDDDHAMEIFEDRADFDGIGEIEHKPNPAPDFDSMDTATAKQWIEAMYAKIPDGFIRKVHPDSLPDDRIRASAKGLFKKYYG